MVAWYFCSKGITEKMNIQHITKRSSSNSSDYESRILNQTTWDWKSLGNKTHHFESLPITSMPKKTPGKSVKVLQKNLQKYALMFPVFVCWLPESKSNLRRWSLSLWPQQRAGFPNGCSYAKTGWFNHLTSILWGEDMLKKSLKLPTPRHKCHSKSRWSREGTKTCCSKS